MKMDYVDSIKYNMDSITIVFVVRKIVGLFYKEDIEKRITSSVDIPFSLYKYNKSYFYRCFKIIDCLPVSKEECLKIFNLSSFH